MEGGDLKRVAGEGEAGREEWEQRSQQLQSWAPWLGSELQEKELWLLADLRLRHWDAQLILLLVLLRSSS